MYICMYMKTVCICVVTTTKKIYNTKSDLRIFYKIYNLKKLFCFVFQYFKLLAFLSIQKAASHFIFLTKYL